MSHIEFASTGAARTAFDPAAALTGQVLVVDDAPETRRAVCRLLSMMGLQVTTAENGQEAIDAVGQARNSDAHFDLVLMDVEMPVMDGITAAALLRHQQFGGAIVVITGCTELGVERQCIDAGCDDFLRKPFDAGRLQAIMQTHLRTAGRSRHTPAA